MLPAQPHHPRHQPEANVAAWRKIERAKHRLFYSLIRLKLPLVTRMETPETGLAFDFLAELASGGRAPRADGPR